MEGRPTQDAELIGLAKDGDVPAYGELVDRYRDLAFRTAYLITRSAADAEDAAQDAFVKAYYALERFRAGKSFRPWILRIVSNEAKNRTRSARRREGLALRAAWDRPSGDAAPSPEAAVIDRETAEELLEALAGLKEDDRLIIAYRYFLQLSEAETATALDIRPGTVKSRLSRALARLRDRLPADRGTPEPLEATSG